MIDARFLRADYTASVRSDMAVVDPTVGREQMRMSLKNHATSAVGFWKSLDTLNYFLLRNVFQ